MSNNQDIHKITNNEEQPLIIISPAKDTNKLIIADNNMFIRCYKDFNFESLPIKLVIKTIIFQKAFIEYISLLSIKINNNVFTSHLKLNEKFLYFMDKIWKLDISKSIYLNKSYRIIGKLWLLNSQFELLKDNLDKNSIIEDRKIQKQYQNIASLTVIIFGIYTIFSGIAGLNQIMGNFSTIVKNYTNIFFILFGVIVVGIIIYKIKTITTKG